MEVIVDESQKNNVDVDIQTLSQRIKYVLAHHENSDELLNVFNEMNVNRFGRVVAYLALVYRMNISEEDVIREAARLVVPILRDTNIIRVEEESFIQRIILA